ncbi:tubby-like F-box protein 11 isoform X2 [Miscanthus floridulus]|uniref:tubby-like F-box protein 11 isoform X2 n=1 Tax=Miscanthus floridulus TaxID=154761 RepID=UPI00345ACBCC
MPFSSMIQEMKGEIGAISSRGLLRFRSDQPGGHAAAGRAPAAEPPGEALRESCWAQVPPELLRMVLARVEDEEARWPGRSAVVASAGVCRCWRAVVKELVRVPEASGKFTFPISLKQPGPRDAPIKCFIRRNRATQSYSLCVGVTDALADDGKFLLAARRSRRPAGTEYLISLDAKNTSKGTCIGKLRVPRKMSCVMDSIPVSAIKGGTAPMQTEFPSINSNSFASVPFFRKSGRLDSSGVQLATQNEAKIVLKNKSPRWHEPLQCWCLNFHGRVTVASVKNFQLVASGESDLNNQDDDDVILQFGKVGKDLFTMDYRYPISAFQAFAICLSCLSSFDTKITRE